MTLKIKKGNARDIARFEYAEAAVETEAPGAQQDSVFLSPENHAAGSGPLTIKVVCSAEDEAQLLSCYKNILAFAKNNSIRSIVIPLLGTDRPGFLTKDLWRIAKSAMMEETSDIHIYLALDAAAQQRIHRDVFSLNRVVNSALTEHHDNRIPAGAFGMMFISSEVNALDRELESAVDCGKEITELFQSHLHGRKPGNVAAAVAGVMQKSTCYNILSYEKGGTKKNLVALGLELHISLPDFTEILDAAGYKFTSSKEDIIYKNAFKYGWDLYAVDELLADRNLQTLNE